MKSVLKSLAPHLLAVACYDREVNCRRAAAAAFQENVGRQGNFPHGIDIINKADYFSLSSMVNSYMQVAVYIAQYEGYLYMFVEELRSKEICHWTQNSTEFIRAFCNVTLYPNLCFKSLEHFANMVDSSSMNLAHAALAVSLVHLDQALVIISRMRFMAISAGEAGALRDCIDNLADSVDEMQRLMREFRRLGSGAGNLRFQISNIQTWVSAALTDEDTCFDDFDGSITFTVRRMMRKIERLTSNSLALFNKFADDMIH
ncbi:hypothetical protein EJ110_NYTH56641 [Nymphaea thermarum]|nr:hypothetical protein EJ110_NYTH56641 [Nymphaea thermarum]